MDYNHFTYSEMLARKLKPIAHTDDDCHFFRASAQTKMQELLENISSAKGGVLIAVDGKIIDFSWNNSDSLMIKPTYGIVILFPAKSTDANTIFAVQAQATEVALQIIAKMMQDANRYISDCDKIDPESFQIDGFGPMADLFYGVELSFNLDDGLNYELNPDMWL